MTLKLILPCNISGAEGRLWILQMDKQLVSE